MFQQLELDELRKPKQHIVIVKQQYLKMIESGVKTIESRFSLNHSVPFGKVNVGDFLLFKETGKNITIKAEVDNVKYYELTPEKVCELKEKYGEKIGSTNIDEWKDVMNKKYCTLVWFKNVQKIEEIKVPKSFGAGWMILEDWIQCYANKYYKICTKETCLNNVKQWNKKNRFCGHSLFVALSLKKVFGGQIKECVIKEHNEKHYYNVINGLSYDYTLCEYEQHINKIDKRIVTEEEILKDDATFLKYQVFNQKLSKL